jgi:phosphatidylserine/phosphatidylglycerophosphate/cardiolipin synthase-like enzyme
MSSSGKSSNSTRSTIATIVGVIIVVVTAIVGLLNDGEEAAVQPTPTPQIVQPTAVPPPPGFPELTLTAPLPPPGIPELTPQSAFAPITLAQGFGGGKSFWEAYFTAPTGSRDSSTYVGGVDEMILAAINNTRISLDIAAFEWNNPRLTQAVIAAHNRGVRVRMVIDDEHALEDEDSTIQQVIDAGIPVHDDDRSGLMHNKFMIMDASSVWTGSMNYTMNGTYRNNNNVLHMRSRRAVATYQAEFDEMFTDGEFGKRSSDIDGTSFTLDGIPVQIVFAPEDDVVSALLDVLSQAQSSIRFMTFSFTRDDVGEVLLERAGAGINVEGIFETRASRTEFSELPLLLCSGLPVLEDGNPFTFHHKVFIIDQKTVLTGSFNISNNATRQNDENMVIIQDADLARLYLQEYEKVKSQAGVPPMERIECP